MSKSSLKIGAYVHMYPPIHNAGAEHMLHTILKVLARKHECRVVINGNKTRAGYLKALGVLNEKNKATRRFKDKITGAKYNQGDEYLVVRGYQLDGVEVSDDPEVLNDVDVLLTHLDNFPKAEKIALDNGIPLVHIVHNDRAPTLIKHADLAVYNSRWIADKFKGDFPSLTIHPPIIAQDYKVKTDGEYITLINASDAKGIRLFYEIAGKRPELKFLVVKGAYNRQVQPSDLPNVTVWEQQKDIRKAYEKTKILLVPSLYESYGRVAVEAAISGIPVIANPTPGLLEALGPCGVFPEIYSTDCWVKALARVLDKYDTYSREAKKIVKRLHPEADIARLETAMFEVIRKADKCR